MIRGTAVLLLAAVAAAPAPAQDFERYPAPAVYKGPLKFPDFKGRDKNFRLMRTRLRDGVKQGPNFAGHYALIQFGCGAGCSAALITDVASGKVYAAPRGGEENMYMTLKFKPTSALLHARWYAYADQKCFVEEFVWRNQKFDLLSKTEVGGEDACLKFDNDEGEL